MQIHFVFLTISLIHYVLTSLDNPNLKKNGFFFYQCRLSIPTSSQVGPHGQHCSDLSFYAGFPSIHPSIVCNRFIPFYGVTGVFGGANPSCLWARAGYSLDKSPAHRRATQSLLMLM